MERILTNYILRRPVVDGVAKTFLWPLEIMTQKNNQMSSGNYLFSKQRLQKQLTFVSFQTTKIHEPYVNSYSA